MTNVVIGTKFERLVRKLRKRYPNILRDIEPLIAQLESGATPGDQLQGLPYPIYKVRVKTAMPGAAKVVVIVSCTMYALPT